MNKRTFFTVFSIALFLVLSSCAGKSGKASAQEAPTPSQLIIPAARSGTISETPQKPYTNSPPYSSHSFSTPLPLTEPDGSQVAILAGGCFWCLEAVFELVPGVTDVVSGYTGGKTRRPSYTAVSMGATGHAEAVRIVYNPAIVSFQELLELFFKIHDPTTLNRQGYDVGTQYRSAIYYVDENQRAAAVAEIEKQRSHWRDLIVTELLPAGDFWIAEEYHQDYFRLNPTQGYCIAIIGPKVEKTGLAQ